MILLWAALAPGPDYGGEAQRQVLRQECRLRDDEAEVVVCGRRDGRRRYQVTDPNAPFDPYGSVDSVARERGRWIQELDIGTGDCKPYGPGGFTGCMLKRSREQRQQQKGQFG